MVFLPSYYNIIYIGILTNLSLCGNTTPYVTCLRFITVKDQKSVKREFSSSIVTQDEE